MKALPREGGWVSALSEVEYLVCDIGVADKSVLSGEASQRAFGALA